MTGYYLYQENTISLLTYEKRSARKAEIQGGAKERMFLKWVVHHQSAMSRCYAIFCVHNFEVNGLTWKKCGSNEMEPQPTRQGLPSMTVVRQMFPQHVVSRFGDVPWPPRSPDLSACDLFLWGYLKSKVYFRKPRTVDDLKVPIREETATVPQEMLVNVIQNFEERLRTCVRQEGRHLSDIIFRK